ncbi:hypothetical protein CLAIMM_10438 [Cladophialophora immunda]|nr:hypothetical protein CLAIMM_10438 [Cladophialophora immunda]
MPQPLVIVIGAGVVGLSAAHRILTNDCSVRVAVVAAELPSDPPALNTPDYASMWAGAHHRPVPGATAQLKLETALARETAAVMRRLAHEVAECGVEVTPAIEYLERPTAAETSLQTGAPYAWEGDGFQVTPRDMLPHGVAWGCEYQTYCVNPRIYCCWLLSGVQRMGARVVRHSLDSVRDAFELPHHLGLSNPSIVVNCSGRGIDADPKVGIVRGQTVLVRQQHDKTVTRQCADGSWAFLIPRPAAGGTVVGGTKEPDDWEAGARMETQARLLETAASLFPDFVSDPGTFEVIGVNVGRRPWRGGGTRIETEDVGAGRYIVHGYGAGGRGYELSWGVATRIAAMVKDCTQQLKASL